MRRVLVARLTVVAAALFAAPCAIAQTAEACAQFKWQMSRELQAFGSQLPVIKSGGQYPGVMAGVTVALEPQSGVTYPQPPARAPKSNPAYGAVLPAPPIAEAGAYQITLSEDAWVDLVQNGTRLRSTAFSGKTGCPGVRKSVRFQLAAGSLSIEISDSPVQRLNLDLLPVE